MRKLLTAFALLLSCSAAFAQPLPPPKCWPSSFGPFHVGGTGTPVIAESLMDNGVYWAWKCPDGSVAYKVIKESWTGPTLTMLALQAMQYNTVIEALTAMWSLYDPRQAACTPEDPCDPDWLRTRDAAVAAAMELPTPPGSTPPLPGAVVVKNGTYPTRPAYALVNGAVGAKEEGRATVGLPCDCAKTRVMKGTSMYCAAPPPVAGLVTLCKAP